MRTTLVYDYLHVSPNREIVSNLGTVINKLLKAQEASEKISTAYRNRGLHFNMVLYSDGKYLVFFDGSSESLVEQAIGDFINYSGLPYFVEGNYTPAENVLKARGKVLKRRFAGGAVGKYVVDLK